MKDLFLFWDNLNLLSPSDVAKIECVRELIDACEYGVSQFSGYDNDYAKPFREALSNFEPKKEGANE